MNYLAKGTADLDHLLGCFGSFSATNTVCLNRCVLNLRCAIEKDQNDRLALLEELMDANGVLLKIQ
jgi:hypothetical protein